MITYDVLRHAQTPRVEGIYADWKADSRYRNLNRSGVDQALKLHRQYIDEGALIRLGLYSPAPRAMYTLAIATVGRDIQLVELDELFTPEGPDGDILNPAFRVIGNNIAPYTKDEKLLAALQRFGHTAAAKIRKEVKSRLAGVDDGIVVIANHAVTGNFVALALSDWKASDVCLSVNLGEADRLRVCGQTVTHIPLR